MKRFSIILAIVLVLLLHTGAQAATTLLESWLYVSDDPAIKLAWDAVEGAARYEVKMVSMYPAQEWAQTVTGLEATFQKLRGGLFNFAVRACDASECSPWTWSNGVGATVVKASGETIQQPWIAFFRLSAPVIH